MIAVQKLNWMPTVEGNSKHLEEDGQNSSEPYYKKLKSDEHYSAECSENRFSTEDYCKTGTDELQQESTYFVEAAGTIEREKEQNERTSLHMRVDKREEREEKWENKNSDWENTGSKKNNQELGETVVFTASSQIAESENLNTTRSSPVLESDPTGLVKQNVTEEHERSSSTTASCKTDLIGYNINAVFIGPRQKGENFKEHCVQTGVERKCELSVALNSNTEDKEEAECFVGPRTKREIEDELNQFYEEIKELESDPNVTSNSESENSFLGTEKIESVGYLSTAANNYNDWKLKSRDVDKPDFYSENRQNHSCPKQYSDDRASGWQQWRPGYLENGQADAAHWNNSPPPFRPEWQPMQSFIVPQGPRLPRFNGPLYHQRPCAPPHALNNFCPPNLGQFGFHENAGNEKWNCAESFENRIYGFHGAGVGNCRIQSPETSYNDQPGINNSGFYEDREKAWTEPRRGNDPPAQQYHLENPYRDDHVRPHLKVLILMRGVPGSGKSTLAQEVLAQHANEGLVLSTDDYFYHNGYSFDGKLLGDAHEWNQNRARDAMNHGRSPIVIDNTNTQAWEMKPYVGMALERGYGVEFHEPHTWWKFDPVELEKRNKHNVPREKIIQMMERFERPISIDIVMNSVQPPHKSSIRPPLQQRQRDGDLKKKLRHKSVKSKHKKKRRRNRKPKVNQTKAAEKPTEGVQSFLAPNDQDTSESEDENLEGLCDRQSKDYSFEPIRKSAGSENGSDSEDENEIAVSYGRDKENLHQSKIVVSLDGFTEQNLPAREQDLFSVNLQYSSDKTKCPLYQEQLDLNHNIVKSNSSPLVFTVAKEQNIEIKAGDGDKVINTSQMEEMDAKKILKRTSSSMRNNDASNLLAVDFPEQEKARLLKVTTSSCKQVSRYSFKEANAWTFFSINSVSKERYPFTDKKICQDDWSVDSHWSPCEQRMKVNRKDLEEDSDTTGKPQPPICEAEQLLKKEMLPQTLLNEKMHIAQLKPGSQDVQYGSLQSSQMEKSSEIQSTEPDSSLRNFPFKIKKQKPSCTSNITCIKGKSKKIYNLAPTFQIPREVAVCLAERREKSGANIHVEVGNSRFLQTKATTASIVNHGTCERRLETSVKTFERSMSSARASEVHVESKVPVGKQDMPSRLLDDLQLTIFSFKVKDPALGQNVKDHLEDYEPSGEGGLVFKLYENIPVGNQHEKKLEQNPCETSASQPDILSSVSVMTENTVNSPFLDSVCDNSSKGLHQSNVLKPSQSTQSDVHQESLILSKNFPFPKLQLPFELALQLVELFGSPGVVLDCLLPEDYLVPLDWEVSKMIYLQWKTSVEGRRKQATVTYESLTGCTLQNLKAQDAERNSDGEPLQGREENATTRSELNPLYDSDHGPKVIYTAGSYSRYSETVSKQL
nr:PREDICTED: uncharacterized protein LOC102350653 isoform X2 [Latimeria chalumnae]|eukprot:XP_014349582.1 PREDICTED: uncharacterized protein LOC102350653 isoform X2 [Latimeria chalumnae]